MNSSHSIIGTAHTLSTGQGCPARFYLLAIAFSNSFALGLERLWQVGANRSILQQKLMRISNQLLLKLDACQGEAAADAELAAGQPGQIFDPRKR